jgi:Na+/proline symporter
MATAIAFFTLNWWAKAPGHGALAQRLLATRSPRDGALALAWFTVAHYVLRPWPWIIVALASIAVIPESFDAELGRWVPAVADKDAFPWMIRSHLGAGARGLLVVAMLGAFMSTVDTHVNLSSAYLLNDVLRPAGRLLRRRPEPAAGSEADGAAEVWKGRFLALPVLGLVLLIASGFDDIVALYKYLGVIAAGTAPVLILRWYWWRTTAWTEIAAMSTSLIAGNLLVRFGPLAAPEDGLDSQFGPRLIAVILISGLIWIPATWLSRPASRERLQVFRRAIRPAGPGWRRIALEAGESPPAPLTPLIGWAIMGTFGIWSAILGMGWLVLGSPLKGGVMLAVAVVLGIPTIRAASRVADDPT